MRLALKHLVDYLAWDPDGFLDSEVLREDDDDDCGVVVIRPNRRKVAPGASYGQVARGDSTRWTAVSWSTLGSEPQRGGDALKRTQLGAVAQWKDLGGLADGRLDGVLNDIRAGLKRSAVEGTALTGDTHPTAARAEDPARPQLALEEQGRYAPF